MRYSINLASKLIGLYLTSNQSFKDVAEKEKWSLLRGEKDIFARNSLKIYLPLRISYIQNLMVEKYYRQLMNNPIVINALRTDEHIEYYQVLQHILGNLLYNLSFTTEKGITSEITFKFVNNLKFLYQAISEDLSLVTKNEIAEMNPEEVIKGFEIKYDGLESDILVFFRLWQYFLKPNKFFTEILHIYQEHIDIYGDKPNIINSDILLACIISKMFFTKLD